MDDDADQLRERVEKLEQIAASQQETIGQLRDSSLLGQWGRRGVLGSIAAVLGVASASGSAAAGLGDVGTPSGRVDAFLDQADVVSLEANTATIDNIGLTAELKTDQTIPSGTVTTVEFDSTTFVDTNIVDIDTSTGQVTIQQDGTYFVSGAIEWSADAGWTAGDEALAQITASGDAKIQSDPRKRDQEDEQRSLTGKLIELVNGDNVEVKVFQTSGSDKTILGITQRCYLSIFRLG